MLSRVTSERGAGCALSGAGRIACTDVGLFETLSCPWPPSPPFDTLQEIERPRLRCTGLPHTPAKGLGAKVEIHAVGIPRFLQGQDIVFVLTCSTLWGLFLGDALVGAVPIKPYCLAVTII